MEGRLRYFPESSTPSGSSDDIFLYVFVTFFMVLIVITIIGKIREKLVLNRDKQKYIDSLPERGYELSMFQSRQGGWAWAVKMKRGQKIEHMNLASYKASPYTHSYHPNRESAEREAMEFLKNHGFEEGDEIGF